MNTIPFYGQPNAATTASAAIGRAGSNLDRAATDRQTIERRAVEFEALYLAEMLKPMFASLTTEAPFGGGFGEDCWRSMQVQQYAQAIADEGGIGLARGVAAELLRAQEASQGAGR